MNEENKKFNEFVQYLNDRLERWDPSGYMVCVMDYQDEEERNGVVSLQYTTEEKGGRNIDLIIETGTGVSKRMEERIKLFAKSGRTKKILSPSEIFKDVNLGLLGMDSQDIRSIEDNVWTGCLGVSPRDGSTSEILESEIVGGSVRSVKCQIGKYSTQKGGFMLNRAKESPKSLVDLAVEIYTS